MLPHSLGLVTPALPSVLKVHSSLLYYTDLDKRFSSYASTPSLEEISGVDTVVYVSPRSPLQDRGHHSNQLLEAGGLEADTHQESLFLGNTLEFLSLSGKHSCRKTLPAGCLHLLCKALEEEKDG